MAIKFLEAGTDASQDFIWYAATSNATSDTSAARTGPRSIKVNTGATPASAYVVTPNATVQDAGARITLWVNFATLPATSAELFRIQTASSAATLLGLSMTSGGLLYNTFGTQTNGATAIAANTWTRISVAYTVTSTTVNTLKAWVNGTLQWTVSNVTLTGTGTSCIAVGLMDSASAGTNRIAYYDDLYIDDSNALTDPGDVRVTVKLPSAAGSTNAFDTLVGSGTNRWDRVSERPFSVTNGLQHAATTQVSELFTVQDAATGDANLTGATILGYVGYVWAKVGSGTVSATTAGPGLTLAGATTNLTLTTSAALYRVYSTTATYPSTNQALGMRSNTNTADTFFYEGGIMIAYTPAPPTPRSQAAVVC
jgi:hypothetical protein